MSEQKPTTQETSRPVQTGEDKILREVAEDYIDSLVFTEAKASTISVYLLCLARHNKYYA